MEEDAGIIITEADGDDKELY